MWNLKMVVNHVQDLGPKENTAIPKIVHVINATFAVLAVSKLPKNALGYYRSGADGQQTLQENSTAFNR